MSVDVVTFGCRLNIYESEVIRREAECAGMADTIVINSCAVTNEAVAQARQSIRKLKRERPSARIVVTGCAAQTDPAMFTGMAEVDRVVGNDDKMHGAACRGGATLSVSVIRIPPLLRRTQSTRESAGLHFAERPKRENRE